MTEPRPREPRAGWIAACCVLTVLVVAAWVAGHVVAGRGDPALQCLRVSESAGLIRLGFDPAHDPDAIPRGGAFLVFPTGLRCESASADRAEQTWWISWPESLAVVLLTLALSVAVAGVIAPRRTVRLLRQERG